MFRSDNLIWCWKYNFFYIVRFIIYHWNIWINLKHIQWMKSSQKHSLNIIKCVKGIITCGTYLSQPLWGKCEVGTHTLENGTWEPSGTPENSEHNFRGQNTLHWNFFYTVGKVLKCWCSKLPRMSHLDIFSTSYGWKKGRESN
jgi:hypothetical protein